MEKDIIKETDALIERLTAQLNFLIKTREILVNETLSEKEKADRLEPLIIAEKTRMAKDEINTNWD